MKNATQVAEIEYSDSYVDQIHSYKQSLSESKTLIFLPERSKYSYLFLKRAFDIILSVFGLLILSPFLLIVALLIKIDSPGKVIYTQNRVGKNGKLFKMYKFRSMCDDAEKKQAELISMNEAQGPVFKIAKDPRITRVGKYIRKCSVDEIPQLLNIIKGDMSIVGPRPPLPNEVEQYTPYQKLRLTVTPGLTCYWQIGGRSDVSFEKWVELDLKYIETRSFWVDLVIIMKTIPAVFGHHGAY